VISHYLPEITEADVLAVANALRVRHLAQGEETVVLERTLAESFAGAEVVGVASGTAALYLALCALGLKRGAKVVIPSYTCNSLYAAVAHAGGVPVCADVQPGGVTVSRETVARVLDSDVAAAIIPHTLGYRADVEGIAALGVPVIEDCAQVFPEADGPAAGLGRLGTLATLSFYATKLLAGGEGGAVVARDPAVAASIRAWRHCDAAEPDPRAFNFKMTDLGAALVRSQLARLPARLAACRRLATTYDAQLGAWALARQAPAPQVTPFRYLLRTGGRAEAFISDAAAAGIECRRPVWRPLHHTLGGDCPESDRTFADVVSIPSYPGLTQDCALQVAQRLVVLGFRDSG